MIIVKLYGGLGNQMFEYAAAKSIALKHCTNIKLDISEYACDSLRTFELSAFNVQAEIATISDVLSTSFIEGIWYFLRRNPGRLKKLFSSLLKIVRLKSNYYSRYYQYNPRVEPPPLLLGRVASQRFFHFDQGLFHCPDNTMLYGTWVSYKYFEHIRNTLLNEFDLRERSSRVERLYEKIAQCRSIALHIRRADKIAESVHPVVPLSFYLEAMEHFSRQFSNCTFFVFSDDLQWAKNNIHSNDCIFIDNTSNNPSAEDLWLMSKCQHNIVPASSFSWWAAWLNQYDSKQIVITHPSYWITLDNFDTSTISPLDWIVKGPKYL